MVDFLKSSVLPIRKKVAAIYLKMPKIQHALVTDITTSHKQAAHEVENLNKKLKKKQISMH